MSNDNELFDMLTRVLHEHKEKKERQSAQPRQPGPASVDGITWHEIDVGVLGKMTDYDPSTQSLRYGGGNVVRALIGVRY